MIDKTKLPTVGYDDMNTMRYEEADLINDLLAKIENGSDSEVTSAIEALLAHMQKHFEYEEGMLKTGASGCSTYTEATTTASWERPAWPT